MVVHDAPQTLHTTAPTALGEAQAATTSRRSILKGIGVGAATVAVAGTGALSYRVYDNGVLAAGSGGPYDAWSQWRDDPSPLGAVGAAVLAANPHNSQPWTFDVTPTRVDVYADPSRLIGTIDPLGREQHIGLGCALENLVLAASTRGFDTVVTLMPQPEDSTHVAAVELSEGTARSSPLYEAIGDRHTNRGPYTTEAVPAEVLADLSGQADGLDGVEVRWFSTATEKTALGALIIDATRAIISDQDQSRDSFAWFRNNRDDIDTHRDGLTLDAQGLSPVTLALAKLLPASSRTAGDAFWLEQTRTVHTKTAAAYGVIIVADPDDPVTRLSGGRLLQRIHLAATADGLALHHMNQVTERVDRERTVDTATTFDRDMGALLGKPGRQVLSTFRVGHPERAARPSPRRPMSAVTL